MINMIKIQTKFYYFLGGSALIKLILLCTTLSENLSLEKTNALQLIGIVRANPVTIGGRKNGFADVEYMRTPEVNPTPAQQDSSLVANEIGLLAY